MLQRDETNIFDFHSDWACFDDASKNKCTVLYQISLPLAGYNKPYMLSNVLDVHISVYFFLNQQLSGGFDYLLHLKFSEKSRKYYHFCLVQWSSFYPKKSGRCTQLLYTGLSTKSILCVSALLWLTWLIWTTFTQQTGSIELEKEDPLNYEQCPVYLVFSVKWKFYQVGSYFTVRQKGNNPITRINVDIVWYSKARISWNLIVSLCFN